MPVLTSVPGADLLAFDPDAHAYMRRIDGAPIPSVTQVLERCGIIDYSMIPARTRRMALAPRITPLLSRRR